MKYQEPENATYREMAAKRIHQVLFQDTLPAGAIDPKTLRVTLNRGLHEEFILTVTRAVLVREAVNSSRKHEVPATWWDHLKMTYRTWLRWRPWRGLLFPVQGFLIRHTYPRTIKTRQIVERTTVTHVCPHLETWLTPGQEHLKWIATYPGEPCTGVYPDQPPTRQ